jgi:hypothetical protein
MKSHGLSLRAGMLRWMADHTQRPRVTRQVDRMPKVPRNVGWGRQGDVSFSNEPVPKMVSIGGSLEPRPILPVSFAIQRLD